VEVTCWELLLILAIHPITGVQAEPLVDIIWAEKPPDRPSASLRKRR
jgi:DNA-binding SARP family transcriptional activator